MYSRPVTREWEPDVRSRDLPSAEALRALGSRFPDFDPVAVETFITLGIVAAELQATVEAEIHDRGLSRPRFITLLLLKKAGTPLTPAELAARTNTTTASMASLLEGLVTAGLIRREPRQDDRRSHYIHVTELGNAKLDEVLPHVYRTMGKVMSPMTADEQTSLARVLIGLRDGQEKASR